MHTKMRRPAAGNGRTFGIDQHRRTTDNPKNSAPRLSALDCRPFRSIGELAAEIAADLVFRRKARLLHRRGERVFGEFLAHVAADRALATYLENELDRFLALSGAALDATGGNRLPPLPLHVVPR